MLRVETEARVKATCAADEAKVILETRQSDAACWSFERTALELQIAKLQQEAAAAAASASAVVDHLNAQVPFPSGSARRQTTLISRFKNNTDFSFQIAELRRENLSLQRPVCCDASELTDVFEGANSIALF